MLQYRVSKNPEGSKCGVLPCGLNISQIVSRSSEGTFRFSESMNLFRRKIVMPLELYPWVLYLLGISPLKGLHQNRLNSLFGPPSQGKYHQFPYDYMDKIDETYTNTFHHQRGKLDSFQDRCIMYTLPKNLTFFAPTNGAFPQESPQKTQGPPFDFLRLGPRVVDALGLVSQPASGMKG